MADASITRLLLGGNCLRERPNNSRNNMAVDQLLANSPLVAIRLTECLKRLPAPVLPHRKVYANRGLRKLAGPNLVGVRASLDAEAALQPAIFVQTQHERRLEVDDLRTGHFE